ncbi:HAD-IA family hydrolase [Zhihengliuella sp.]|uniref:HAD family hydrolase n=1 Tax=Zhihengliuella sp. TaxID=1954483 RepID=UPI0028120CB9|nr:HAD-IA family hydrolase [Zhihengliuella sp.]
MEPATRQADGSVRLTVEEILFDMDGTLIDSIAAVEAAWRSWAAEFDVAMAPGVAFHGRTAADLVASLVPGERFRAALERLEALERVPACPVLPLPGALELLARLPPERWSIVTSAARPVAVARLAAAGVPLPARLVTGDDVEHGKPSPAPFLAGRLGTGPAVAFEDTVAGLASARAAGCATVGIIGTYPVEELRAHADHVIEDLAAVTVAASGPDGLVMDLQTTRGAPRR